MIRSKQYNILIVLMLLVTIFVSGCSQEEDIIPSNGTLCLSIGQTSKVEEWVLAQGMYAKPLAPKWLVDSWKEHIQGICKLAGM